MKMHLAVAVLVIGTFVEPGSAQEPAAGRGAPGGADVQAGRGRGRGAPGGPGTAAQPARSPEVHADGRVTFRLTAPKATEVAITGEFAPGQRRYPLQKDAQGVWSVTLGPFEPETYEYDFHVDGVQMLDPRNPLVKYNRGPAAISSLLDLRGSSPRFFDVKPVPHGKVEMRFYDSKTTKQVKRVHIYTPPNYEKLSRLPVLYLLHGADGEDSVWSAFGRVHVILDNLIAEKKAQPMVVVMPVGYAYTWDSGVAADKQQADFQKDLIEDLIPYVQANYRVSTDRKQRALAGLSRGGGQTVSIGLRNLGLFSRLGVFSAGGNPDGLKDVATDAKKVNEQLDLLWIGCGTEDGAMAGAQRFADFLTASGIEHTFKKTSGEHTWIVWRRYLNELAPLLWGGQKLARS